MINTLYTRYFAPKTTVANTAAPEITVEEPEIESTAAQAQTPSIAIENETEDERETDKKDEKPAMATPDALPTSPSSISTTEHERKAAPMPPPSLPPLRNRSPPRLKPATSSLAPPPRPTPPRGGFLAPSGFTNGNAPTSTPRAPTSASSSSSSLSVPQQRTLANTKMQPALAPTTSTQPPSKRSSRKVILSPGHSPLDWAALTKSTTEESSLQLRGRDASGVLGPVRLGKITPSQLKRQTGRKGKDAWTSYQGKVYNISAYLDFHPGGRDELMKGAGRSSDALFAEVHPWVNWDGMLVNCLVGMLVSEDDPGAVGRTTSSDGAGGGGDTGNVLDEMD